MNRCFFYLAWVVLAGALFAQPGPKGRPALPATDLGRVSVGAKAPDFTLRDMHGKETTLSSFRGRKDVVLVFYRGHW